MNKIIQGDCLEVLKTLPENSVDSIVTDPPYELGFMGKSWDNTGIANNPLMWAECLRVLKPGGHLLSFGGTRTYHRMAVAIEDAGFEVRDMIEWVYSTGFPKSLNIGKAVDKLQGNNREVIGENPNHRELQETGTMVGEPHTGDGKITKGTSPYEGWGTALKPAHEPICMARKPLAEKTVAENCIKYGTGGINIDESRVEMSQEDKIKNDKGDTSKIHEKAVWENTGHKERRDVFNPTGRFPANLIHDNSEEVRECFPSPHGAGYSNTLMGNKSEGNIFRNSNDVTRFGDSGNASRFFKSIPKHPGCYATGLPCIECRDNYFELKQEEWDIYKSIIYQAKSSKSDRNSNGSVINTHPTVKSIPLMSYLIKMVTPKGGTVLDPFAGSGSTLVAAKQNGFNYIGIEMTAEYIPIIEARLK